jgi:tetratricopeptide (TPR) repeat protein
MDAMARRLNRRAARWAVGALAFASLIAAGCGDTATIGSIPYTPATPGTLRVATALPAPGFWDGGDTPESITGGYEYELATLLADRFDLELELVAVPFDQIASGDLAGAEKIYLQILNADPGLFGPRYYLGLMRLQQGRNAEAATYLGEALQISPDNLGALMNYGMALQGAGRSPEALEAFDKALTIESNLPEAHYNRGVALANMHRFEMAVEAYDRALVMRPEMISALINRLKSASRRACIPSLAMRARAY